MSKLDDILKDADWTQAIEQPWTAKEAIKNLFEKLADDTTDIHGKISYMVLVEKIREL